MHSTGHQDIQNKSAKRPGLLSLRQRSAENPLGMFTVFVGTAFAAMMLVPPTGTAFASLGSVTAPAIVKPVEDNRSSQQSETRSTAKGDRLPMSETEIACRGQAWGSESEGCLAVIEKESGKREARKIRVIANAADQGMTTNIF